jgi:transcriptional regulator with XRE-family HTH domain
VARLLLPRQTETLAQFLERALDKRKMSVNKLASQAGTGKRQVRRWKAGGKGGTKSLTARNAAKLGNALDADFTPFIRRYERHRDRDTKLEQEVAELRSKVEALQKQVSALRKELRRSQNNRRAAPASPP